MSLQDLTTEGLARFSPDPDRSAALPGGFYYDAAVYEREQAAIFDRSWLYAGHLSDLAEPGQAITQAVGSDLVTVRRDPDGALTAGRRGGPVRVAALCGFVFVNLDPEAPDLRTALRDFEEEFLSFGPRPEQLVCAYRKELEVAANWKNVIENYAECYHCPVSHPGLATAALDMNSYFIAVHDAYHVHSSGNCGESQGYQLATGSGPRDGDFSSWFIWPNTVFEYYPGGKLTLFHNKPLGPERTLQTIEWYLPQDTPTPLEQEIIDFVDEVRIEDIPIVESVQRGLHNRGYRGGRFITDERRSGMSEHAVHDFQHKVLTALELVPNQAESAVSS